MTERRIKGFCTLCKSRCGAIFTSDGTRILAVEPDPEHPTGGALCAKGRAAPEILSDPDRLKVPLRRTNPKGSADPGWEAIGWDEALTIAASRLAELRKGAGPHAVAFATTTPSGSSIGDSIEWIDAFIRQFGSPNVIAAVEVCNFQKDYGQALTFGAPLGALNPSRADAIVLWGHNPARTWLAQASAIAARPAGTPLVVIDPDRGGSGQDADLWLGIRPGTDGVLALGAIRHLLAEGRYDAAFLRRWTDSVLLVDRATGSRLRASEIGIAVEGYVAMTAQGPVAVDTSRAAQAADDLLLEFDEEIAGVGRCTSAYSMLKASASAWTLTAVSEACGLPADAVLRFLQLLAGPGRISYYHWSGLTQSDRATQAVRAISTLFALRGDVDQPGANRWLTSLPGYPFEPSQSSLLALGLAALPLGPPRHGFVTVRDFCDGVLDSKPYPVKALVSFGTNLLATQPDSARTIAALERLDFHLHVDVRDGPMATDADIVLPATLPWEHEALRCGFELSERSLGFVQLRPAIVSPDADQRPDYAIARELAVRIGLDDPLWHGPVETAWDRRLAPLGLDIASLRNAGGSAEVPLDHPVATYRDELAGGLVRGFGTPSRRVELYSEQLALIGAPGVATAELPVVDEAFPLILASVKRAAFTHSSYRTIPSLARRASDPEVRLTSRLAEREGIAAGDWCRIATAAGSISLRARLDDGLADDVLMADFGVRSIESRASSALPLGLNVPTSFNDVVDHSVRDPVSGSPPMRRMPARIERDHVLSQGNWAGDRWFRVHERRARGGDVIELTLVPEDGGKVPVFVPGQHVQIDVGNGLPVRSYSLTSAGHRISDHLAIAVRRQSGGTVSCHVHDDLPIGCRVTLRAPSGRFRVPVASRRPLLLVAAGVGITPFVSMVRTLGLPGCARPEATVLYVVRQASEAAFHEELSAAGIDYRLHETRVMSGQAGDRDQRLARAVDAIEIDARTHAFLCGPPAFMAAVRALLIARGVAPGAIEQEAFAAPELPTGSLQPAMIGLRRSGRSFAWRQQQGTILDAALAAGIALPNGCRAGQCGSCALSIVSGSIHHAVDDVEAGACLTCCAVPIGDVTLDA